MANFWFHDSIRRTTIAFMRMFSKLEVQRMDIDGNVLQTLPVPISFDAKSKMIAWINGSTFNKIVSNVVPRISVELMSLNYNPDRKIQPFNAFMQDPAGNPVPGSKDVILAPAPWDIGFILTVWTKHQVDALQIIEQICATFNPAVSMTVEMVPQFGISNDMEVVLNSCMPQYVNELSGPDERVISWELDFTVLGYMYPPIRDQKIIMTINAELELINANSNQSIGLVTVTEDNIAIQDPGEYDPDAV